MPARHEPALGTFAGKDVALYHDARAYGAVGDGATDSTVAIQAAINAAETEATLLGGAIVRIPAGTYLVSETLVVSADGVCLRGDGPGGDSGTAVTMLTPTADFADDTYVLSFANPTASTRPLSGVQMQGIRIGKVATLSNTVHGIYWKVYYGAMEHVAIKDLTGHALALQGESGVWDAYQNDFYRLDLWGPGGASGSHVGVNILGDVIDNFFTNCQIHGFRYGTKGGQTGNRYMGCHFWGNGNNVLLDGGGVLPKFVGCDFREPVFDNFLVDCTGDMSVVGLELADCGFRTTDTLGANNSYDNLRFTRSSGGGTVSGVIGNNDFISAGSTNKVRYHVNLSGAVCTHVRLGDSNRYDNNSAAAKVNHNSSAVRCLVGGLGRNIGDPNSTGAWNSYPELGVRVWDTGGTVIWECYNGTNWVALSS